MLGMRSFVAEVNYDPETWVSGARSVFELVSPGINEMRFHKGWIDAKQSSQPVREVQMHVIPNEWPNLNAIRSVLESRELRAANLGELIAFAREYPGYVRRHAVGALGSWSDDDVAQPSRHPVADAYATGKLRLRVRSSDSELFRENGGLHILAVNALEPYAY